MFDVIIVGARCAGAPTAMLLARRGHRVLLVDRSRFPSDIPHGFFIHRGGPARLHRWGLLDRILATGCPAVDTVLWDLTGFSLVGRDVAVDGVAFGCGPDGRSLIRFSSTPRSRPARNSDRNSLWRMSSRRMAASPVSDAARPAGPRAGPSARAL